MSKIRSSVSVRRGNRLSPYNTQITDSNMDTTNAPLTVMTIEEQFTNAQHNTQGEATP